MIVHGDYLSSSSHLPYLLPSVSLQGMDLLICSSFAFIIYIVCLYLLYM